MDEKKDSGVEWLGEIPAHWKICKTLYILSMPITDGPHETPEFFSEGIPFVSAEAVSCGNGKIDFNHIRGYISQDFYQECCKKYIPRKNDIYLIKSGATTGKVALMDTEKIFTIWSPLAVFRVNEKFFYKYLFYFLQSNSYQQQILLNWNYGTQQNIGMRVLEKLKVCFPPLEEQKKIAAYLDRKCSAIDSAVDAAKKMVETLAGYKKSLITETVTKGLNPSAKMIDSGVEWIGKIPAHWKISKLKYLADIKNGQEYRKFFDENGKYPVIGSGGEFTHAIKFLYDKPSVLLGRKGTIDKPLFVDFPFWVVDTMYYTEIKNAVLPKFFFYLCLQIPYDYYRYGSALPSMTQRDLNSTKFPLPPVEEQKKIAAYLDKKCSAIDESISAHKNLAEKLSEYKKSLIYEVVTGKISV